MVPVMARSWYATPFAVPVVTAPTDQSMPGHISVGDVSVEVVLHVTKDFRGDA